MTAIFVLLLAAVAFHVDAEPAKLWANGVVPYTLSDVFEGKDNAADKHTIQSAIDQITAGTCVKFVKRTTEPDFILISQDTHHDAPTGNMGGQQSVLVVKGTDVGGVQQELMHVLGFHHEHQRADRDQFITVNWSNVRPEAKKDYDIVADQDTFGLPYDFDSVLHSEKESAVDAAQPTITPKGKDVKMGAGDKMSPGDFMKIKKAYKC